MKVLQTSALATWLRRRSVQLYDNGDSYVSEISGILMEMGGDVKPNTEQNTEA